MRGRVSDYATERVKFEPQLLVEIASLAAAAFWVVASVRTTTAVLSAEIKHLRESIDRMRGQQEGQCEAIRTMEHRLTLLESATAPAAP
jgi:hypothetical protein